MAVAAVNSSTLFVNDTDVYVNSTTTSAAASSSAVTRVGILTIPQMPYCSFAGKTAQVVADVSVPDGGGRGQKASRRLRYPRRIMVDGRLYIVSSPEEERQLLESLAHRALVEAEEVERTQPVQAAKKRRLAKRIQRRVEKAEDASQRWQEFLEQEDEEILSFLVH